MTTERILVKARGRRTSSKITLAALAGYVGAAGAADVLNPEWSPVERMVSHYVHARAGWLIPVALLSLAAASALLLRSIAARTSGGRAGVWLLGVWTAAVLTGALFPTDPPGQWDRPPSTAGLVHGMAALFAFVSFPIAAVLLTRVWRRDPRRRKAARLLTATAAMSVTALLALVVLLADVMDGPSLTFGPWESVVGLAERLALWSYVAWLAIAAAAYAANGPLDRKQA